MLKVRLRFREVQWLTRVPTAQNTQVKDLDPGFWGGPRPLSEVHPRVWQWVLFLSNPVFLKHRQSMVAGFCPSWSWPLEVLHCMAKETATENNTTYFKIGRLSWITPAGFEMKEPQAKECWQLLESENHLQLTASNGTGSESSNSMKQNSATSLSEQEHGFSPEPPERHTAPQHLDGSPA